MLHLEECRGDGSRRFACHLGVNRSDLATGLRLDEGPARRAAAARAATVRALDERYGLRQLERGRANSRAHARQPSPAEREMARDRRTGVVVRFTARGIREGLEAFRALKRVAERQYEQGGRTVVTGVSPEGRSDPEAACLAPGRATSSGSRPRPRRGKAIPCHGIHILHARRRGRRAGEVGAARRRVGAERPRHAGEELPTEGAGGTFRGRFPVFRSL